MSPVNNRVDIPWTNVISGKLKQQNLLRLAAAMLWVAAALVAFRGNTASMLESPSLIPLGLMGGALLLQCLSHLLAKSRYQPAVSEL